MTDEMSCQISDVSFSANERALIVQSPQPVAQVRSSLPADRHDMDVFVIDTTAPPPRVLLADMDSTIIESETLDDLAAHFGIAGPIAAITERAMRGELDFGEALTERVAMLEGLPESAITELLPKLEISHGAAELIAACKAKDMTCVLISGGFTHVTGYVADKLGFDAHHGNEFVITKEKLTGEVKQPIQDKDAKLKMLNSLVSDLDITSSEVIAVGDGANDIPMLQAVGYGVAYHAKPKVIEATDLHIIHTDLSALIYLL
ncbi:MAG: phosphoserine phosphatase SerB [Pseudomonadota bacterium]